MPGQASAFGAHPVREGGDTRSASIVSRRQAFIGGQPVDLALDGEQRVDAPNRLKRDREMAGASLPRRALAAMSASTKNFRREWLQHKASVADRRALIMAILRIVDADDPPLRFVLGSTVLPMARAIYAARLATWEAWETVSNAAQGEPRPESGASSTTAVAGRHSCQGSVTSNGDLASLYHDYISCVNDRDLDRLADFVDQDVDYNGRRVGVKGYREMLEGNYWDIPDLLFPRSWSRTRPRSRAA